MTDTLLRRAALAAAATLIVLTAACGHQSTVPSTPPPLEVGVVVVQMRAVPLNLSYMAHTAGAREVEVRARVGGILLRRQYVEGTRVKEGALLFRIDPAPYAAEVARTRAQLGVQQAQLAQARQERDRVVPLLAKGLISRHDYDVAIAAFNSADAATAAAQAALERAQLDLAYTEVRAPIGGLTSRETRSEGSLVTTDKDSSLLTRIVQTDPLYIEMAMPAGEAALVRAALQNPTFPDPVRVIGATADGHDLPQAAELTFLDTAVDLASGTVQARATLPNPKGELLPGQFLRARIAGVSSPAVAVIPVRAVLRSPMGSMVWVVGAGDKVEPRPVQLGDTVANDVVVLSGLKPGERVIVDGVIKVRPGAAVKPAVVDNKLPANGTAAATGAG
jgi:membrane fusion protein (multidrug efflux system)